MSLRVRSSFLFMARLRYFYARLLYTPSLIYFSICNLLNSESDLIMATSSSSFDDFSSLTITEPDCCNLSKLLDEKFGCKPLWILPFKTLLIWKFLIDKRFYCYRTFVRVCLIFCSWIYSYTECVNLFTKGEQRPIKMSFQPLSLFWFSSKVIACWCLSIDY